MLENELEIGTQEKTVFVIEDILQLENLINEQYPNLILPLPLNEEELDSRKCEMNYEERQFAKLLLSKGMIVYREPEIELCDSIPDFFVYNPRSCNGKLVEITLAYMQKEKKQEGGQRKARKNRKKEQMKASKNRKNRQKENLNLSGIPSVVLYREQMENIRRYCCNKLF